MSDYLAYGVTFAISDDSFILLEKGPLRVPIGSVSLIEVNVSKPPSVSMMGIVCGAIALLAIFIGSVIVGLLFAAASVFFFVRGPSKTQIYRCYIHSNQLSGSLETFTVANYEMEKLERALSNFSNVKLQIK